MRSANGRYITTFNGEIYNFRSLRAELEGLGHQFRGSSDTEVMLAAISQWAVPGALERFVGMFAFALWDREDRSLHLARDRLGEKPLYYGWVEGAFLFASELKALYSYPGWKGKIDQDAVTLFMRHGYIPAPYSIYQNIFKLTPGTFLRLSGAAAGRVPEPECYWSLARVAEAAACDPFSGSEAEAQQELESLLRQSVAGQMVADVPLGAFLSGGIDSSTIVAVMQAQSAQPVKTFTIGFRENRYNEAQHAKAVAHHLGTQHTELYVTPGEALGVIPSLPAAYDEPFGDSSQIPTMLLSQLAKRHVTVSLSGDGGDELFGGYTRYRFAGNLSRQLSRLPHGARRCIGKLLKAPSVGCWDGMLGWLPYKVGMRAFDGRPGDRLHKLAELLESEDPDVLYERIITHWLQGSIVSGPKRVRPWGGQVSLPLGVGALEERMMYLDTMTYLPDDILVKLDRASMSVSLESRVPLLDHHLVEFAWRLPLAMKMKGKGKWLLRQVLYKYVPSALVERPKMGFGVPLDDWLRGPLRDWADALLNESRLRQEGFLSPVLIQRCWKEHLKANRNWQYHLWDVLMFQAWLQTQR